MTITSADYQQPWQATGTRNIIDFNLVGEHSLDGIRPGRDGKCPPLDFPRIKMIATNSMELVLNHWLPGGKVVRGEYLCGSTAGGPGESCSTNVRTGVGADFATGEKWGDAIELVAKIDGLSMVDAARRLEEFFGVGPETPVPAAKVEKLTQVEKHEAGKKTALALWVESETCPHQHPYLLKKQVPADQGIRLHTATGNILIPLYDETGTLWSVQRIFPDGDKKVNHNGKVTGNFFTIEGERDTVYICEGYATAQTVALSTGKTAVMAVNSGNLSAVGEKLCKLFPTAHLVFAADNDNVTPKNPNQMKNPGVSLAEKAVKEIGRGTVIAPPADPETKVDWNDYALEHGAQAAQKLLMASTASSVTLDRVINLYEWGAEQWSGEPPKREYLVSGRIPLGVAVMVAAMGDTGKSFILLLLALLVATGRGMFSCMALGGYVQTFGTAVVFTAEEDTREVHSRIAALDPEGRRFLHPGKLLVVPLPDAGGPVSLVMQTRDGLKVSPEFEMIRAQLLRIPDLKMVVFDPLQNFVQVDINADPAAGQFACAVFAQLAAETGATVILPHHMKKSAKPIETVADARDAIRGTTALVDGLRAAYALWPVADDEAKKICKSINVTWQPNRVVAGAVVKANGQAERRISTFIREDCGVLRDASAQLAVADAKRGHSADHLHLLEVAIKSAAIDGQPFTKTGINGLFDRRSELPETLQSIGRTILWQLTDELLSEGKVVKAIHKGTSKKWLDVPDGPFATGAGMIRAGA